MRKQIVERLGLGQEIRVALAGCEPQDRPEIAAKNDRKLSVIRHQRHLIDQRTEHLRRLAAFGILLKCLIQLIDPLTVDLRHVRVQQGSGFCSRRQKLGQLGLPGFEFLGLVLQLLGRKAFQNGLDHLVELSVCPFILSLPSGQVRTSLDPKAIYLSRELGAEFLEQRRLHQMLAQTVEDRGFEGIAPDVQAVVAGALVARCGASQQVFRDQRIATPAAAAFDQPRKQMFGPPPHVQGIGRILARAKGEACLPRLHSVPDFLLHNPKLRHVLDHPVTLGVRSRNAAACIGILQVPQPVPDQPPDVEFVVQDTRAALGVAMNGRRPPFLALRAWHTLTVQRHRDGARRLPAQIVAESPLNDRGLGLIDRPPAAVIGVGGRHDIIAKAQPAA